MLKTVDENHNFCTRCGAPWDKARGYCPHCNHEAERRALVSACTHATQELADVNDEQSVETLRRVLEVYQRQLAVMIYPIGEVGSRDAPVYVVID